MSLFYKAMYAVGFTPWERAADSSRPSNELLTQISRDEIGDPPYGRALDVGCGRGRHSIELARRGWQVTGVDAVPKAVTAARDNARDAGVDVTFVYGDATRLSRDVTGPFRYLLDLGCFHGLTDAQRAEVVREEEAVTETGSTLLMMAFQPGRRGPLPRGIDAAELRRLYADWALLSEDEVDLSEAPRFVQRAGARFFRLRRN